MKEEIKKSKSCKNEQKTQSNLKGINLSEIPREITSTEKNEINCNDNSNNLLDNACCCRMIYDESECNSSVLFEEFENMIHPCKSKEFSMQSNLNEKSQLNIKNEKDEDIKDTFPSDTPLKDYLNYCEIIDDINENNENYAPEPLTTITEIKIKKYPPIPNKKKKKQKKRCWNCGSEGHLNKNCPALSPEIKELRLPEPAA